MALENLTKLRQDMRLLLPRNIRHSNCAQNNADLYPRISGAVCAGRGSMSKSDNKYQNFDLQ